MKSIKMLNVKTASFILGTVLIVSVWSCTGNQNSTDGVGVGDTSTTNSSTNSSNTNSSDTNSGGQNSTMADNNTANNSNAAVTDSERDAEFMVKAAKINMEEIKLGKLAQKKGTMPHVKELGKMMVTEHTEATKDLTALAKSKNTALPTAESEEIIEDYNKLNAKSGKDFDKAYSDMMVEGHKDAIDLFEKANSNTKDPAVKAMTAAMLPKLKAHLEHAEICKKECEKM